MSNLYDNLDVDPEEVEWEDLAMCSGMDTNLFYSKYESSAEVAELVDQVCLSCPVTALCGRAGIENGEYGVWGGFYLNGGKVDQARNEHKTPEVMKQLRQRYENDL